MSEKDTSPKTHKVKIAVTAKVEPSLTVKVITASEAAASVATTDIERDAILQLGELFGAMDDRQLYVCFESGVSIADQIGVKNVPEAVIKACAAYEARERRARKDDVAARRAGRQEGLKIGAMWAAVGLSALGIVAKLLGWL